ncbi:MAG: hypothetical protein KGI80_06495 [Verrucomicrobiota bacterium]|nr:hypothetical protein [Verrucomicrobiota bacterium]
MRKFWACLQLFWRRLLKASDAPEVREEDAFFYRANARQVVERRTQESLGAPFLMIGERMAVRFIANALQ